MSSADEWAASGWDADEDGFIARIEGGEHDGSMVIVKGRSYMDDDAALEDAQELVRRECPDATSITVSKPAAVIVPFGWEWRNRDD